MVNRHLAHLVRAVGGKRKAKYMRTKLAILLAGLFAVSGQAPSHSQEVEQWDRSVLPIAPKPFEGHVGLRTSESMLDFPAEVKDDSGEAMEMDVIEAKYFKFLKA